MELELWILLKVLNLDIADLAYRAEVTPKTVRNWVDNPPRKSRYKGRLRRIIADHNMPSQTSYEREYRDIVHVFIHNQLIS